MEITLLNPTYFGQSKWSIPPIKDLDSGLLTISCAIKHYSYPECVESGLYQLYSLYVQTMELTSYLSPQKLLTSGVLAILAITIGIPGIATCSPLETPPDAF